MLSAPVRRERQRKTEERKARMYGLEGARGCGINDGESLGDEVLQLLEERRRGDKVKVKV